MRDDETSSGEYIIELRGRDEARGPEGPRTVKALKARTPKVRTQEVKELGHGIDK